MMKENYGRALEQLLAELDTRNEKPRLLMQACCAPCSSYVLEYIAGHFDMTMFYYNPNISPEKEFRVRVGELRRFLDAAGYDQVGLEVPPYNAAEFFDAVHGMEACPEGGERCRVCYELRLRKTAEAARDGGYDFFCTTLSISPYKHADWLNDIGRSLEQEYGVRWLVSDFKKKNGYKRSIELSHAYGLYRQDYCGCIFSKAESERHRREAEQARQNEPAAEKAG